MAEILFYNTKHAKDYDKFKEICAANDVKIIEVKEDQVDHYVGYLLGMEGFSDEKKTDVDKDINIDFDFILFSNFDNEKMFRVMDEVRDSGGNVLHKAGTSQNNGGWSRRDILIDTTKEA